MANPTENATTTYYDYLTDRGYLADDYSTDSYATDDSVLSSWSSFTELSTKTAVTQKKSEEKNVGRNKPTSQIITASVVNQENNLTNVATNSNSANSRKREIAIAAEKADFWTRVNALSNVMGFFFALTKSITIPIVFLSAIGIILGGPILVIIGVTTAVISVIATAGGLIYGTQAGGTQLENWTDTSIGAIQRKQNTPEGVSKHPTPAHSTQPQLPAQPSNLSGYESEHAYESAPESSPSYEEEIIVQSQNPRVQTYSQSIYSNKAPTLFGASSISVAEKKANEHNNANAASNIIGLVMVVSGVTISSIIGFTFAPIVAAGLLGLSLTIATISLITTIGGAYYGNQAEQGNAPAISFAPQP